MSGKHKPRSLGKTYIKTIVREIRFSFGRFAAIFGIVALGAGFLAGLLATTPDMKISVDTYFDKTNMMDLNIKATMGITRSDIEAVSALDEITLVQGAYITDALIHTSNEETLVSRIYGLPLGNAANNDFINRMEILEGRMPEQDDECLVQQPGGFFSAIPLGSVLTIAQENAGSEDFETLADRYRVTRFTVTGIVKSPLFISTEGEPSGIGNGRLGVVLYVRDTCYSIPAYTDLFMTVTGAAARTALDTQALTDTAAAEVKSLGKLRSGIRREELLAEAWKKLSDGTAEYHSAEQTARTELGAAREKLDAGAASRDAGLAELAEAETKITQGRAQLAEERLRVTRELADNEFDLQQGEAEIASAKQTLAEAGAQLQAAGEEVEKTRNSFFRMLFPKAKQGVAQYDAGMAEYETGRLIVAENEEKLRVGRTLLEAGKAQAEVEFGKAQAELDAADAELAAGLQKLTLGEEELSAGEAAYRSTLDEATEKLQSGKEALEEGREKIKDLETAEPEWYVLDRNTNVGYVSYTLNIEKIADVARVFPVFFLLVAALVVLTTMTRMVEEERIQIGTLKALGYRKRVIAGKYLVYCGLISIFGSAAGMTLGFYGIPAIIYNAFATMGHLPPLVTRFNWTFGIISAAAALICTMGVTVSVCYRSLREKPALLMLPRSPKAGKRIFLEYISFIWKPMRFTYKVTARNIIRYKKHFFMTVTGIAGCTALMVTGFGLRDSLTNIARTQFSDILSYDLKIELKDGESLPGDYAEIHSQSAYAIAGNERLSVSMYIPKEADTLTEYIKLQDRKSRSPINFTASSVVLTEKTASMLKLKTGDPFILENAQGKQGEFTLTGITENYVGSFVYLGSEASQAVFGTALDYGTLFARTNIKTEQEKDELISRLLSEDAVAGAEFTSRTQESYNNLLASISYVVLILIIAAGGLAMIVLYNLTNININERTKELATLRVLGFHQAEAAAYIFREITVLSIAGAAAGLLLGIPLHRFVIGVAETTDLMFGRHISSMSFILSAVITLFFSGAVDLLMLKKIRTIKMAESMKAVD
ncbi:ABC transporter permease [Leadbettera azotonutricia]|uniref:ABC transporter, permease protein n=1 Tax=Leadbettera azotonutricia (strain ATCC BAA-888 / DSM 13862 / ZAS-9) TaxID=545695 RepID=F5YAP0_LEAAZ|nr:ABC transporter permease [Leadbettera azotonutricia]AEF82937.1 ABC transporter, permease protein [Leadbettera azotonutricia ZAS-9]